MITPSNVIHHAAPFSHVIRYKSGELQIQELRVQRSGESNVNRRPARRRLVSCKPLQCARFRRLVRAPTPVKAARETSTRSRLPGRPRATRIMYRLAILACALAAATAAPATYDQRQDGDLNVQADLQNIVILVAVPQKMSLPLDILDGLIKFKQHGREAQDRADVQAMEAFVEPSTPYRVEIGPGGSDRSVEGDGRAVEVVIAGRRRSDGEPQSNGDELKLIGDAIEQCGPERERDPVTLICRARSVAPEAPEAPEAPQVVPSS